MTTLDKILSGNSVSAAKKLIGWRLFKLESSGELVGGVITETEAYREDDAASHSYRGITPRTEVMFGPPGHLYVYFTYGMHWCMNIVTGRVGDGSAVLIRSIKPTEGIDTIRKRCNYRVDKELMNGPAKICQALNVTGNENGQKIGIGKFILKPPTTRPKNIIATKRIGITRDAHRLWRFVLQ